MKMNVVVAQRLQDGEAIHTRHPYIAQDQIGYLFARKVQPGLPIGSRHHLECR
jgi:hypothetical protein